MRIINTIKNINFIILMSIMLVLAGCGQTLNDENNAPNTPIIEDSGGQDALNATPNTAPNTPTETTQNIIQERIEQTDNARKVDDATLEAETHAYLNQPDPEALSPLPDDNIVTLDSLLQQLPNRYATQQGNDIGVASPLDVDGKQQHNPEQEQLFEQTRQRLLALLGDDNTNSDAEVIRQQLTQNKLYGIVQEEDSKVRADDSLLQAETLAEQASRNDILELDTPIFTDNDFDNAAKQAAQLLLQGEYSNELVINNQQQQRNAEPSRPIIQGDNVKRIAVLVPLSGRHKHIGDTVLQTTQLALQHSNNKHITLLPYDTKGTPQGAINAVQHAVKQSVDIIIGPVFSKNTIAIRDIVVPYNIPIFSLSNDHALATEHVFIFGYNPQDQINALLAFFNKHNITNIAAFAPETPYGDFIVRIAQQQAVTLNLTFDRVGRYNYDSSNFAAPIVSMSRYEERKKQSLDGQRAAAPSYQAVILPEVDENNIRAIAAQLDYFDSAAPNVILAGLQPWDYLPNLPQEKALHGAIFVALNREARISFERTYQRVFKQYADPITAISFDAAALALYLLQRDAVMADLFQDGDKKKLEGVDGTLWVHKNGHITRNYNIYQIQPNGIVALQ